MRGNLGCSLLNGRTTDSFEISSVLCSLATNRSVELFAFIFYFIRLLPAVLRIPSFLHCTSIVFDSIMNGLPYCFKLLLKFFSSNIFYSILSHQLPIGTLLEPKLSYDWEFAFLFLLIPQLL